MSKSALEQELVDAGERLFEALKTVSEEERQALRAIRQEIDRIHEEQEKQGKYIDRSALFAAEIIRNDAIKSEALRDAARGYVEADHRFVLSDDV